MFGNQLGLPSLGALVGGFGNADSAQRPITRSAFAGIAGIVRDITQFFGIGLQVVQLGRQVDMVYVFHPAKAHGEGARHRTGRVILDQHAAIWLLPLA